MSKKRKKSRKRRIRLIIGAVILVLLAGALVFLNSSFFDVKQVTVEGTNFVSPEDVVADMGLSEGTNLFRYFVAHLFKKTETPLMLRSADVYVEWPDTVRILVDEENFVGYVYYQGTYLCLNRKGVVIGSSEKRDFPLPLITGIMVGSFSLGKEPVTDDSSCFKDVLDIANVLKKYALTEKMQTINVRDRENIILDSDTLKVCCGPCEDIDIKIAVLSQFLKEYGDKRGILHLEDVTEELKGQAYLETVQ